MLTTLPDFQLQLQPSQQQADRRHLGFSQCQQHPFKPAGVPKNYQGLREHKSLTTLDHGFTSSPRQTSSAESVV